MKLGFGDLCCRLAVGAVLGQGMSILSRLSIRETGRPIKGDPS